MSDTVSFTELDGQHVELLPARTVLSMFSAQNKQFWSQQHLRPLRVRAAALSG